MAFTIKYIGGPRAGKTLKSLSTPRTISCSLGEQASTGMAGHYYRKDVDTDLKVAAYQWKES